MSVWNLLCGVALWELISRWFASSPKPVGQPLCPGAGYANYVSPRRNAVPDRPAAYLECNYDELQELIDELESLLDECDETSDQCDTIEDELDLLYDRLDDMELHDSLFDDPVRLHNHIVTHSIIDDDCYDW